MVHGFVHSRRMFSPSHPHPLTFLPSHPHPLTFLPSHPLPLTFLPSHPLPLTFLPSHPLPLTFLPSHPFPHILSLSPSYPLPFLPSHPHPLTPHPLHLTLSLILPHRITRHYACGSSLSHSSSHLLTLTSFFSRSVVMFKVSSDFVE